MKKYILSILLIILFCGVMPQYLNTQNNTIIEREIIDSTQKISNIKIIRYSNIENKNIQIKEEQIFSATTKKTQFPNYFTNIDSVIVKFWATVPPYNFRMKFTENGVYIKGKYNYSPINYAPQLASLVNQLYITKTTNIITEKRKYSGNIVAEYPILYVLIYKGKTIKETSTIFGEYQGNYKYTYSDEFKEFNRLLELCAFELIN